MSRRKGLSLEEKRMKVLEIFYESKDFYQLKELEKIAPKQKGVISQSVKEVVQSLVDDNLVDTDKIGTCVYFWSFPSKSSGILQQKKNDLTSKLEAADLKLSEATTGVEEAKLGREDSGDRLRIISELESVKANQTKLKKLLLQYADSDPETIKRLNNEAKMALDAANRWTDNVFSIKSWCKNKFFLEEEVLNKQFDIPEDLDYLEMK